ncbi:hypothetical protein AB0P36_33860 [Streptomyces flavidovirens]|uniref:hypothetical protein n=1 Tax=Streptomyces flavidovirens TaxID=67298 RepID=UPI00342321F5
MGPRGETYDLASLLDHTPGGEDAHGVVGDTREAGDEELVTFLQEIRKQDRERAQKVKQLLAHRLSHASS